MLRAVISDVTVYFVTIFLTHLLLVVTIETARVRFRSSFFGLLPLRETDQRPTNSSRA